jgi:outer membrane protein, heavy metal efflux system
VKKLFVSSRYRATVALVFLGPVLCRAQTRLSLQEAISQALASRPSLQADSERISQAQALRKQAAAIPNPEFQFQNENLRPGQTYGRDVDTLAMINQPLDILGKRRERMTVADQGIARSRADYDVARWDVVRRVRIAYWAARGAQEIRDVLKTTADNFQKIVDYHANQLSVGAIAEQDVLRVRLEQERINITANLAAIDADRASAELLKAMGRADFGALQLTEALTMDRNVQPAGVNESLAQRVEIKAARAALEEARAAAKFQDTSARPDLNVTYGYKRTQLPDTGTGVNTAIVSVRVTLPVTDKNRGNREAAYAEIRRREDLLAAAENDIRVEYNGALHEYELRRSQVINALQPLRDHAANISKIASDAYAEGGVDLLRLLDAERTRLDADLAWARGISDYWQSVARLEGAEGIGQ